MSNLAKPPQHSCTKAFRRYLAPKLSGSGVHKRSGTAGKKLHLLGYGTTCIHRDHGIGQPPRHLHALSECVPGTEALALPYPTGSSGVHRRLWLAAKSIGYAAQCKSLTVTCHENPEYLALNAQPAQVTETPRSGVRGLLLRYASRKGAQGRTRAIGGLLIVARTTCMSCEDPTHARG
jgi:hypothetical protein